jgi:chromosome segregation ATPase
MKRDVSFSLLGLILLLCLGLAVASVYFQNTYNNLQSKYKVSNETLQETIIDYQEKEKFLDAALQNLSLSEEREEALGGKYQEVETEKVGLQTDLAEANEAIKSLNRQKEDLESNVDNLKRENGKLVFEKDQLEDKVIDLEDSIDDLNDDIDDLKDKIKVLEANQTE